MRKYLINKIRNLNEVFHPSVRPLGLSLLVLGGSGLLLMSTYIENNNFELYEDEKMRKVVVSNSKEEELAYGIDEDKDWTIDKYYGSIEYRDSLLEFYQEKRKEHYSEN